MPTENRYEELGSRAAKLIKLKAAEIVGLEGFTPDEREDIEQDLALEILRRTPDFDPERASYDTFVTRVVDHAMTNIIDKRWAAKRNPRRVECSLNELVPDGEGSLVERAETMDRDTYLGSGGPLTEQELLELRLDLEEVLKSLTPRQRLICDLLVEGKTLPEVAELIGVSSRTAYRARAKIRERFSRAGLSGYFGRNSGKISGRSST